MMDRVHRVSKNNELLRRKNQFCKRKFLASQPAKDGRNRGQRCTFFEFGEFVWLLFQKPCEAGSWLRLAKVFDMATELFAFLPELIKKIFEGWIAQPAADGSSAYEVCDFPFLLI